MLNKIKTLALNVVDIINKYEQLKQENLQLKAQVKNLSSNSESSYPKMNCSSRIEELLEENPEYTLVKWSGKTTSYHHKHNNTLNPEDIKKALVRNWILNVQWTNCPIE